MTRRNFLQKVFQNVLALAIGSAIIIKKAPRKFICALKTKRYPGRIKQCQNIDRLSKWSG